MKNLIAFTLLFTSHAALAGTEGGPEQRIFAALEREGVYLHYSYIANHPGPDSTSFYLENISCTRMVRDDRYACLVGDTARPFEQKDISGESAQQIYEGLVASGIEPKSLPFMHGTELVVSAAKLQCKKDYYPVPATYSCQRLKPLVE